ncbi:MAG TPA: ACP S-malonyltransferase [Candidatus Latescibacteria bacterium]|mgnify:FL=1|nr:ACP S-malonyltransferase [Candidatus Latescibacterota bacterium]
MGIAFLFPGQGSQYVGMGADLFAEFLAARRTYEDADALLGWPVTSMSFAGPAETLNDTRYTQPAVFVHSMAVFEILRQHGIRPDVVAGHSLGEYAALCASGALEFGAALRLVAARAAAMADVASRKPGTMAAVVGLDERTVEKSVEGLRDVVVANYNAPDQVVISGAEEAVRNAGTALSEWGAKRIVPLKVSGAFHSPLMAEAARVFADALEREEISTPGIPVIPNVTARRTTDPEEIRSLLVEQITSPVRWTDTVRALASSGSATCFEVGPGRVLQGLVRRIAPSITTTTVGTTAEIRALLKTQ